MKNSEATEIPSFPLRGIIIGLVILLAISAIYTGIRLLQPEPHTVSTFDETLLAEEPLQMSDIRLSLNGALYRAEKDQWSMALRLIRDGRNQWEAFLPSMNDVYIKYAWTPGDIERSSQLWEDAVRQAELRNPAQLKSCILSLIGIMDKYRQHRAG